MFFILTLFQRLPLYFFKANVIAIKEKSCYAFLSKYLYIIIQTCNNRIPSNYTHNATTLPSSLTLKNEKRVAVFSRAHFII